MLKKSIVAQIALVCSLMLFFAAASFAARGVSTSLRFSRNQPPKVSILATSCEDEEIAKAVVEHIRNGFTAAELETFRKLKNFHVGVTCQNKVVSLVGWVAGKATLNKVVRLAGQPTCVKSVNKKTFSPFRVGGCQDSAETDCCGDGQICVTKGSACPKCILD